MTILRPTEVRQQFIKTVTSRLKREGFKKKGSCWFKRENEIVKVFNIQASPWNEDFYVDVAIGLLDLLESQTPPECKCQVRSRLQKDNRKPDAVLAQALSWFDKHGTIQVLGGLARSGRLPPSTTHEAVEYLEGKSAGIVPNRG